LASTRIESGACNPNDVIDGGKKTPRARWPLTSFHVLGVRIPASECTHDAVSQAVVHSPPRLTKVVHSLIGANQENHPAPQ